MAKIPLYNRTQSLTTQAPNVQVDAGSYGAVQGKMAQMGNTIAQGGEQITNTTNQLYDQFKKAKDFHEELQSDVYNIEKLTALSERAEQDPDIENNLPKYIEEANRSLEESAKGISDPQVKDKFMLQGKLKLATVGANLRDLARKNIGSKAVVNTSKLVMQHETEYAVSGNKNFLKYAEHQIDQLEKNKFITPEKAYTWKVSMALDANEKLFAADMATPEGRKRADKRLTSNFYNFDTEKQEKARAHFNQVNKVETTREESIEAIDVFGKIAKKEINWANIQEYAKSVSKKNPQLAEAMVRVVDSDLEYDPTDPKNPPFFAKLVDGVFTAPDQETVADFLTKFLNENPSSISKDEMALVVNAAMTRFNGIRVSKDDKNTTTSKDVQDLGSAYEALSSQIKQFRLPSIPAITNFLMGVSKGIPADQLVAPSLKFAAEQINPSSKKYAVGDKIPNSYGEIGEVVGFDPRGVAIVKRLNKPSSKVASKPESPLATKSAEAKEKK